MRDRLVVVEGRWQSLDSPDRHVWTEVPGPDAAPSLEFAMVAGSAPAASRSVLEGRCAAGPRADAVGRECARLLRTDGEVTVERGAAVWGRLLRDGTDLAGFSDAAVALAAVSLHAGGTPALRDALAGWLTPGFLTAQEMHPVALAGLREHLPLPWWDSPRGQADPATSARLLDRLIQVAGCLPDPYAVPVLTVLAHTAWNQGNGIIARVALDRARAVDPAYYLAALLDRMVTEGCAQGGVSPRTSAIPPSAAPVHRRGAAASPAVAAEPGRLLRLPGRLGSGPAVPETDPARHGHRPTGYRPGTVAPGRHDGSPRATTGGRGPRRSAGRSGCHTRAPAPGPSSAPTPRRPGRTRTGARSRTGP